MGRVGEVRFHAHQVCRRPDALPHFLLGRHVVFQREGDVLRHRQADELAVGVLQHRAHEF